MEGSIERIRIGKVTGIVVRNTEEERYIFIFPHQHVLKGRSLLFLISSSVGVIPDVYNYINNRHLSDGLDARMKRIYALKFLYEFIEIQKIGIRDFDEIRSNQLISFLDGIGVNNDTGRSVDTINHYLGVYQDYFRYLDIMGPLADGNKYRHQPKHISRGTVSFSDVEIKTIQTAFLDAHDMAGFLIFSLMIETGARNGSILGLTVEDLQNTVVRGVPCYYVILRNRISDDFGGSRRMGRNSKTHQHPVSPSKYKTTDYIADCEKLAISKRMYELLCKYIEESRSNINEKNYRKAVADSVEGNTTNHYLFLNSRGEAMSAYTFRNRLRQHMIDSDIPVDNGRRRNNLAHRCRATFAKKILKKYGEKVANSLLGHVSESSLPPYIQMTMDEQSALKEEMNLALISSNPYLKL